MNILKNAFCILGVDPRDDRNTIAKEAEYLYSMQSADAYLEARDILTDPLKRLTAELTWFPGVPAERVLSVVAYIHSLQQGGIAALPDISSFPSLAKLNFLTARLPYLRSSDNIEQVVTVLVDLDDAFRQATPSQVVTAINHDREIARFPKIKSYTRIEQALYEIRLEIRNILSELIESLAIERAVDLAAQLIDYRRSQSMSSYRPILDDAMRAYENRAKAIIDRKLNAR